MGTGLTVFVDIDGVLVDFCRSWLNRYNQDFGDALTVEQIVEWEVHKFVKPECGPRVYDYLYDPTLYDAAFPIPGSLEGIRLLRAAGYRVVFATSTAHGVFGRKLDWLLLHRYIEQNPARFYPDYVEINDKSLLRGDVLIDDGWHNILMFQGIGILVDCPWNRAFDWPHRVYSVIEAAQKVDALKIPKPH